MNAQSITIDVTGQPAPKGSMRAFTDKRGNARVKHDNAKTVPWCQRIEAAAREHRARLAEGDGPMFLKVPLRVRIEFRMRRPSSHYKKSGGLTKSAPVYPATKPDGDKLLRAVLDAVKSAGIIDEDSRFCRYEVSKVYAPHAGGEGATIEIERMQ